MEKTEKLYLSDFSLDELMELEALLRIRSRDSYRENSWEFLAMAEQVFDEIIERVKN